MMFALAILAATASLKQDASPDRFLFCNLNSLSAQPDEGGRLWTDGGSAKLVIGLDSEDLLAAKATVILDSAGILNGAKFPISRSTAEPAPRDDRKLVIFATGSTRPSTQLSVSAGSYDATIVEWVTDEPVVRYTGMCIPSWEFADARSRLERELQK